MAKKISSLPILLSIYMLTVLTLAKARHISLPPSPSPSIPLAPSPEAGDAPPEKDQYQNLSPQNLSPSPSPSPHTQTSYFPTGDYYSPPSFSSQDALKLPFLPETEPPSTATSTETGGGYDDLWTPPQQPSEPIVESSYTSGDDGDNEKNEYSDEEENEKPVTTSEGNGSGGGHGGRVVLGLVMGAFVVGLGGFVCKKRREQHMRRRVKYVYLARR